MTERQLRIEIERILLWHYGEVIYNCFPAAITMRVGMEPFISDIIDVMIETPYKPSKSYRVSKKGKKPSFYD